ncbi:testis-expressed protein 50 [Myotis daubentonii]|uniref:testis-expressed protein 50 n=1 Tax=Myotis daubentonii TaxID=98922 RepID=UPI002873C43D|nr:testis-expressed protein 50 [Myotis daubentonii]
MSIQELPLMFLLLCACLLKENSCICDGTTWAKVGWEIFPEEMLYLKVEPSPSHCLPYPMDKLWCNFINMDVIASLVYLICILGQAISLILLALSVHYLWMKWKRHKKELKKQASIDTVGNEPESQSINDIDKLLFKLLATTSMMSEYLDRKAQRPSSKKFKHGKLKYKNRGGIREHQKHVNVVLSKMETTQSA